MKRIPLLPRYFRWIGLIPVLFSLFVYINDNWFRMSSYDFREIYLDTFVLIDTSPLKEDVYLGISNVNLGFTIIVLGYLLGLMLIAFSRGHQIEDEYRASLRLYSWSIIISFIYLIVVNIFVFGTMYLTMVVLFPHILLFIFLIIFFANIWKMNRRLANEE